MRTAIRPLIIVVVLTGALTGCTGQADPTPTPTSVEQSTPPSATPSAPPSSTSSPAPTPTSGATDPTAEPTPSTSPTNDPAVQSTWIVTPGTVGPFRLGMLWTDAEPLLRGYTKQDVGDCPNLGYSWWESPDGSLQFQTDEGTVAWIEAGMSADQGPRTPGGLHGGSTVDQLGAEYPTIERTDPEGLLMGHSQYWAAQGGTGSWIVFSVAVETGGTEAVHVGADDMFPYEVCG